MRCPKCGRATSVVETRAENDGLVIRRRRECGHCGHRFNTYEVDEGLSKTIAKYLKPHIAALNKRHTLTKRNEKIADRLMAGEKHVVIAADFGLSDNMITHIARQIGIPPRRTFK